MNHAFSYTINSRVLNTSHPLDEVFKLNPQKNYLFPLLHLSVIDVSGNKVADFLQGQLTANIHLVNDIHMIRAAQCTLQGRIITLMDVLDWQGFKLILPQDLLLSTCHSLAKVAMLSRVNLQENKHLSVFGFYLQNPNDLIPGGVFLSSILHAQSRSKDFCYYHLGDGFYIFIVENAAVDTLIKPFIEQECIEGSLTWHTLRLAKGEVSIYPESRGLFLPHRLNLHQTSYISFDKGCYKGQEIIARTQYRATLKHGLHINFIDTDEALYSGQKIFMPESTDEIGELIDYSYVSPNKYLIAASLLNNAPDTLLFEPKKHREKRLRKISS